MQAPAKQVRPAISHLHQIVKLRVMLDHRDVIYLIATPPCQAVEVAD